MGRKRATADMSVAEIEALLKERTTELDDLQKRRETLKTELREVESRITTLRGKKQVTTKKRKKPSRKRPKNRQPLKSYIIEILTKNKKGLSMNDLVEKINETDYKTTSSNMKQLVYQQVYHNEEFTKDEKSGLYRLA